MAFTNKRFSKDDKEAIIKKIVESKEIQDKLEAAIDAKVQEVKDALKNVPTVTPDGEDLVVTFKADGAAAKSYKLNTVAVAITEDHTEDITVFEEHTSPN